MFEKRFTQKAEIVLKISEKIARELAQSYIGTEHLLYGLAGENKGIAHKILLKNNIPFTTKSRNAIITAYTSLVIAKNNTSKMLIVIDTYVVNFCPFVILHFVSTTFVTPTKIRKINVIQ